MGLPNSAASGSAVAAVAGASRGVRLRRSQVAPSRTTSSLWPSAGTCATASVTPKSANGIERDHGFLKERLRPMRGLKSRRSTAVFVVGHALVRNIGRGFYRVAEAPKRLLLAWSWTRLAEAV